jgi:hypothetical protein
MEITTRCGQDADCNPSSAGGILGTLLGYDKIPDYWKQGLKEAEDLDFKYTHTSLNDVYEIGMKHALENIRRNGGKTDGKQILIRKQLPEAVRFEESFSGLQPVEKKWLGMTLSNTVELTFEGNGFVIKGDNKKQGKDASGALVGDVEVYIDGLLFEKVALPVSFTTRRYEIAWKYDLKPGKHTVQLKLLNPNPGMQVYLTEMIIYSLPRL